MNTTQLFIGNIVIFIGALFMVAIGLIKSKKNILIAQNFQFLIMGIGNLILGGTSGFISNMVSIARNLFFAILFLVPAGIALLFIVPAGIYHNIFTFLELKLITVRLPKVYIYEGVRYYGSKDKKTEQDP